MLNIYRRHVQACAHRDEGRKYRRCRCPIWVDGVLGDLEIRESVGTRDWETAQTKVREWEVRGSKIEVVEAGSENVTLIQARDAFLRDAVARNLQDSTLKKYRVLFSQLTEFCEKEGRRHLKELDLPVLRRFRESWADSSLSALKKLERLRAFNRFAHDSGWVTANLAKKLRNPKVTNPPTLPFTKDEFQAMLTACSNYPGDGARLRALVLLLRYSGMRIGDTATCERSRLQGRRLLLYMQKTNEPVFVALPDFVARELTEMSSISDRYFFWTGEGDKETVASNWRRSLRKLFKLASVHQGHPHRLRDTFAVELLLAEVPIEQVSILLGHASIKVTERHYAPWIHERQIQLEASLERAWRRDPIVIAETTCEIEPSPHHDQPPTKELG